jgi:hypothetical protein
MLQIYTSQKLKILKERKYDKSQNIKKVNVIKSKSDFLTVLVKAFVVTTKRETTESNSPPK